MRNKINPLFKLSSVSSFRFILLFSLSVVLTGLLSLGLDRSGVVAKESDNMLSAITNNLPLPESVKKRVPETVALFLGGILFSVVLDRWRSRRSRHLGYTPLAHQAQRLKVLKMGYPEGMTNLEVLREQGSLERYLEPFGLTITWSSYLSASSLIEDLSNGVIDFCGGGGTASLFSQAAEHVFVRVAKEKYTDPKGQAILVPEDSPIKTLADLKGKKIAFDLGSSAHYVLIRALAQVGLQLSDVEPVYLSQTEALPLFRRKEIDAWVVWVPYKANALRSSYPGGSIADLETILGDKGNASLEVPTLYYAVPELVRDYPDLLKLILEEVNEAGAWAKKQELETAKRLAEQYEIDPTIVATLEKVSSERAIIPLDDVSLTALQHQANVLRDLRLIPKRINVKDGTYSLQMKQNWTY